MKITAARLITGFICCFIVISCRGTNDTAVIREYYVSPGGNDANPGTIEKPWETFAKANASVRPGDTVYFRTGTYRERCVITASGTADEPITFSAYPNEIPIVDGSSIPTEISWGGLIESNGIDHIRIIGFTVRNSTGAAIFAMDGTGIAIENNTTYNSVWPGIMAWGDTDLIIRGNEVVEACTGGEGYQECISVSHANRFEITGNKVHHGHMEGIDAKAGCRNGIIRGNIVHDLNRLGIYIDAWDGHEHDIDIYDNEVYACSEGIRVNAENGGSAEHIRIFDNSVHDCAGVGFWIGVGGVPEAHHTVRNVELYRNRSFRNGSGIVVSVPSNGITEYISVYNNLLYENKVAGISVDDYSAGTSVLNGVSIINNTIWGNGFTGEVNEIPDNDWSHGGIFITASNVTNAAVRNNIVSGNRNFTIAISPSDPPRYVPIDTNLIDGFRTYWCETRGDDYVEGSLPFVNVNEGDFRLLPESPAIDRGKAEDAPQDDFYRTERPYGSGFDIGAVEYISEN